jgi:hypothetical protein
MMTNHPLEVVPIVINLETSLCCLEDEKRSNLLSNLGRDSLDNLARTGVGKPVEKRWTPFSRFGRDGEEGQRWMPFSKLTRPRFGKRGFSQENMVGGYLDLADHGVSHRFGRKALDLEF